MLLPPPAFAAVFPDWPAYYAHPHFGALLDLHATLWRVVGLLAGPPQIAGLVKTMRRMGSRLSGLERSLEHSRRHDDAAIKAAMRSLAKDVDEWAVLAYAIVVGLEAGLSAQGTIGIMYGSIQGLGRKEEGRSILAAALARKHREDCSSSASEEESLEAPARHDGGCPLPPWLSGEFSQLNSSSTLRLDHTLAASIGDSLTYSGKLAWATVSPRHSEDFPQINSVTGIQGALLSLRDQHSIVTATAAAGGALSPLRSNPSVRCLAPMTLGAPGPWPSSSRAFGVPPSRVPDDDTDPRRATCSTAEPSSRPATIIDSGSKWDSNNAGVKRISRRRTLAMTSPIFPPPPSIRGVERWRGARSRIPTGLPVPKARRRRSHKSGRRSGIVGPAARLTPSQSQALRTVFYGNRGRQLSGPQLASLVKETGLDATRIGWWYTNARRPEREAKYLPAFDEAVRRNPGVVVDWPSLATWLAARGIALRDWAKEVDQDALAAAGKVTRKSVAMRMLREKESLKKKARSIA